MTGLRRKWGWKQVGGLRPQREIHLTVDKEQQISDRVKNPNQNTCDRRVTCGELTTRWAMWELRAKTAFLALKIYSQQPRSNPFPLERTPWGRDLGGTDHIFEKCLFAVLGVPLYPVSLFHFQTSVPTKNNFVNIKWNPSTANGNWIPLQYNHIDL